MITHQLIRSVRVMACGRMEQLDAGMDVIVIKPVDSTRKQYECMSLAGVVRIDADNLKPEVKP